MRLDNIALLKVIFPAVLLLWVSVLTAFAAIPCDLNDPDRDVPRLFPESTSYKTVYVSIGQRGGAPLLKKIENRLGERYLGVYAPIDVPYTLYEIYNGKTKVGYIHGVNQKGRFGGIQVFMARHRYRRGWPEQGRSPPPIIRLSFLQACVRRRRFRARGGCSADRVRPRASPARARPRADSMKCED